MLLRLPLRPRMLFLHPSLCCSTIFTCSSAHLCRRIAPRVRIGTRSLSQTGIQPVDKPEETRRKRERFAEPYRTNLDLDPFSCDWEKWNRSFLHIHWEWHDLSMMEFYVKRVAKVPGTIRPLAFVPDFPDPCIAFEAAGKYYYLNTAAAYLDRFGSDFESHDEFLAGLVRDPPIQGARHEFPDDTDDLYAAVCVEQQRKVAKAVKAVKMLSPA
ncbi:hypothetical protein C8F04DRAFT_1190567 [Mycena alexandri]|uniref:Uncharacterized protein n=1 Tax=Mycena alexandri TaxID=1745969 RepID=A0AAD6WZ71_9AGAR|nr:hypothetical protein C8F04DRAFT_1190567 [Mycena alexandri]